VIEKIRNFIEWGGGSLGGHNQVGCCGFGSCGFDTRGCFLLWLPSSLLTACCRFGLRLLRPGCLPGGGHFRMFGRLRDRLIRWFWNWGGEVVVASTTSLLGRRDSTARTGPSARQSVRSAEITGRQGYFGDARVLALQEPPSLLSTRYSPGSSQCDSLATTVVWLFSRGGAPTAELGAATRDAPGCASAVTLRVTKALAALAFQ
jgi:hypothetical protein